MGRVRIVRADDHRIEAVVRGTQPYDVWIECRDDGPTTLDCSCPYADEYGGACKHLWATILEAERMGYALLADDDVAPGVRSTSAAPAIGSR